MFVVAGSVAAGLVVHGRVRGGALALRNFCEFGLHGTRKKRAKQPSLKAQAAEDAPAKSAAPDAPPLGSYLSGAHVGQRTGQAARREDPWRHRLFQKRRERSARAVMVPKTPGEKPPGLTLSQAQAGAGSGAEPWRSEIFRILRVELLP